MRQSRRSFLDVLAGGRAGRGSDAGLWIAARGREDYQAQAAQGTTAPRRPELPPGVKAIRISSNENPLGPGKAALDAIVKQVPRGGTLSVQQHAGDRALVAAVATKFGAKPENVVLGAGSQEILKSAVRAFTSPTRGLVTAAPSFENCPQLAKKLGHPVAEIKVDAALQARPRRHGGRGEGRRPRLPQQPQQPDGDGARRARRSRSSCSASAPRRRTR